VIKKLSTGKVSFICWQAGKIGIHFWGCSNACVEDDTSRSMPKEQGAQGLNKYLYATSDIDTPHFNRLRFSSLLEMSILSCREDSRYSSGALTLGSF
jgi:hypothetical protein